MTSEIFSDTKRRAVSGTAEFLFAQTTYLTLAKSTHVMGMKKRTNVVEISSFMSWIICTEYVGVDVV